MASRRGGTYGAGEQRGRYAPREHDEERYRNREVARCAGRPANAVVAGVPDQQAAPRRTYSTTNLSTNYRSAKPAASSSSSSSSSSSCAAASGGAHGAPGSSVHSASFGARRAPKGAGMGSVAPFGKGKGTDAGWGLNESHAFRIGVMPGEMDAQGISKGAI